MHLRLNNLMSHLSLLCLIIVMFLLIDRTPVLAMSCTPTPWDEIGPFYRPNAPMRNSIGRGYVLSGTVRSAGDCRPLPNIRIEIWHTGPGGVYDDSHRATLISNKNGKYRLQTDFPTPYEPRPAHIHILVDAKGFEGLITQHYPKKGAKRATFDLVLVPEVAGKEKSRTPMGR